IEAFACHLPPQIESAMLVTRPKWINLEYLSAESWVETCHGAPSPQSSGLSKYFFFPGFSQKTGGLLCERALSSQRAVFLQDQAAWWQSLGWPCRPPQQLLVSLFCYPHAAVADLFDAWKQGEQSVLCLIPEGIVSDALTQYCQSRLRTGERYTSGKLTLQIIPFTDQTGYDRLLWACDLNFVRGEDSFVRAQWAARPFVWHIYPQAEDIHLEKLQAFLQRYQANLAMPVATLIDQFSLAWNRGEGAQLAALWPQIVLQLPQWRTHASAWAGFLAENGDLADNLLQFIAKID
ncbi:MAG: elongation factor maturation arginine rhamnosyltransferase EarP, partial [Pseudomonadota bacterium]